MRLTSSVSSLVAEKLPVTLQLAGMAIIVALGIGIPAGIISAVKKDTAWDYGANIFALWGISTPNFWLGILMIFLFSVTLGWLPASGYVRLGEDWRASLATTVMPAFVLGNAIAAVLMRHTVDAVFNRDYAVVQGVVLVTATTYIVLNLLADVAYMLVNPRLRG